MKTSTTRQSPGFLAVAVKLVTLGTAVELEGTAIPVALPSAHSLPELNLHLVTLITQEYYLMS